MSAQGVTIADYQAGAEAHAYFLRQPDPAERHRMIAYGYTEEMVELLGEGDPDQMNSLLWGQDDPAAEETDLPERVVREMGDVLWYITAAGMLQEVPLAAMIRRGTAVCTGRENPECVTLTDFDREVASLMQGPMPETYQPDYLAELASTTVIYDADGQPVDDPTTAFKPLSLHGDGRLTLERTLRAVADHIAAGPSAETTPVFTTRAGIALAALPAVAQGRLGSSLNEAAVQNLHKLERRARNRTLEDGPDKDRTRPTGKPCERLSGIEATLRSLGLAPQPNVPAA